MRALSIIFACFLLASCAWERSQTDGEKAAAARVETTVAAQAGATSNADKARDTKETARQVAIAQASSNLEPIAQAVAAKGESGLANITRDQKRTIDGALDLPASQYPAPTVDRESLLKDAEAARGVAQKRADELQSRFDAAALAARTADEARLRAEADARAAKAIADEEKAKADSAATKAWWLQAGGVALGALTAAAGLAARLGLPGGQLVSMAVGLVTPHLTRGKQVAEVAVASADVGRSALNVLDRVMAKDPAVAVKVAEAVSKLTSGRAGSVEGLFKLAAKSHAIDEGAPVAAVDSLLTTLREGMTTEGGMPATLSKLLTKG